MDEARSERQWDHTAAVLAMLFNVNRGKDTPARTPASFHPHRLAEAEAKKKARPVRKMGIETLAAALLQR